MSERIPSLFDAVEGNTVRRIHEDMAERNAEWLGEVRARFLFHYAGREVTTDDVWAFMDAQGIELPEGASPNLLGSFFSGWSRAKATGWTRSKRPGAHANPLRRWELR